MQGMPRKTALPSDCLRFSMVGPEPPRPTASKAEPKRDSWSALGGSRKLVFLQVDLLS